MTARRKPCERCHTLLDSAGCESVPYQRHHTPKRCLAVVIGQRDEAVDAALELCNAVTTLTDQPLTESRAALEKLRGSHG